MISREEEYQFFLKRFGYLDDEFNYPKKVLFRNQEKNLMFTDGRVILYPMRLENELKKECFSFLIVPPMGTRTFLPKKAKEIKGLVPNLHFK